MPTPFCETLKSLREKRGLTYASLGRAAGLSKEAVRKIEGGIVAPNINTLRALAFALGTTASKLIEVKGG